MTNQVTNQVTNHVLRVYLILERIHAEVECQAPEGAPCRLVCAEGCAEDYLCGSYADDNEEILIPHALIDGGSCNAVDWIENSDGADECCLWEGKVPVSDGMPIDMVWGGNFYQWKPASSATPAE